MKDSELEEKSIFFFFFSSYDHFLVIFVTFFIPHHPWKPDQKWGEDGGVCISLAGKKPNLYNNKNKILFEFSTK